MRAVGSAVARGRLSEIRPEDRGLPAFPYTLLDVFTATPLEGNELAVVHEAGSLDDETMLAIGGDVVVLVEGTLRL